MSLKRVRMNCQSGPNQGIDRRIGSELLPLNYDILDHHFMGIGSHSHWREHFRFFETEESI